MYKVREYRLQQSGQATLKTADTDTVNPCSSAPHIQAQEQPQPEHQQQQQGLLQTLPAESGVLNSPFPSLPNSLPLLSADKSHELAAAPAQVVAPLPKRRALGRPRTALNVKVGASARNAEESLAVSSDLLRIEEPPKSASLQNDLSRRAKMLRVQRELAEVNDPKLFRLIFKDPDNLLDFQVEITPQSGYYNRGRFLFLFDLPGSYPIEPPKVLCMNKIFHPNIDTSGNVCLNLLREDWTPVLTVESVLLGLLHLFLEPNPDDPLNKQAAGIMSECSKEFSYYVSCSMRGNTFFGTKFDNVLIGTIKK